MTMVQANARVPEEGRPVLLKVAARMRDEPGFIATLEAFLAGDEPDQEWRSDLADLRSRVESLEAARQESATKPSRATPPVVVDSPVVAGGPVTGDRPASGIDWQARVAAITVSTGEGKGRRLTGEGAALFAEMVHAGENNGVIGRMLGMQAQSVISRKAMLTKSAAKGDPSLTPSD